MTEFWLLALLLGGLAAGFVIWPLFGAGRGGGDSALRRASNLAIFEDRLAEIRSDRDAGGVGAEEAAALEAELKRSLLRDADPGDAEQAPAMDPGGRRLLLGAALAAPLLAVVLYADWGLSLGALADLALAEGVRQLDAAEQGGAEGTGEVRDMAVRLAARLASEPDDLDGWFLLGRTRLNLGEFDAAADAFAEVATRAPAIVAPRVFQAQALYMADDRAVTPRVRAIIDAVLTLDPGQPIMLELLAMDAFQNRRYPEAADLFSRVLASDIQDPDRRRFLEDGLARARELAGLPASSEPVVAAPESELARGVAAGPSVQVDISISDAVLAGLPSGASVFVLARAVNGPRMPLAVERLAPANRLSVVLTVEDAMSPAMSLASVDTVEVVVRLSMTGVAAPGPGDLEALVGPLLPATSPAVAVRLDPAGSTGRLLPATDPAALAAAPAAAPAASPGKAASGPASAAATAAAAEVSIPVLVELAEGLVAAPDASVFVFAREVGGPPMPLAVARLTARELPTLVTLDESTAMMPGRSLAGAERIEVVARITAGGGVVARPGDLEGSAGTLDPRAARRVVPLLIDRVVE